MKPSDIVARFRELGATATPIKSADAAAAATPGSLGGQPRQYRVQLLPQVTILG